MTDEIKVGDTVRDVRYPVMPQVTVIGVHKGLLWLLPSLGHTVVGYADDWRKVKTPTPCPELWANVYPHICAPPCSTRAEANRSAGANRIGVLHLSPNGDCEFIRTEEL